LNPRPDALPWRRRLTIAVVVGLGLSLVASNLGPWALAAGLSAGAVTAVALGRLEPGGAKRRRSDLLAQTPAALDAMAACLEAGLPLRRVVEVVAQLSPQPLASRLALVVNGVGVGLADADAWLGLADDPVLGGLARDLARSVGWGTAIKTVLTDQAAELRRAGQIACRVRARSVGVRTVLPLGLCHLPSFILLGVVPILGSGLISVISP
jgi:pilus assembly protein TadC